MMYAENNVDALAFRAYVDAIKANSLSQSRRRAQRDARADPHPS
jgi:hypothetical protein